MDAVVTTDYCIGCAAGRDNRPGIEHAGVSLPNRFPLSVRSILVKPVKLAASSEPKGWADRIAGWIVNRPWWVIAAWVVLAIACRVSAPSWQSIALDGDFDYLPATSNSVAGGRLLQDAFPGLRARSEMVLVVRPDDRDTPVDGSVEFDLLRRLHYQMGQVAWRRAIDSGYRGGPVAGLLPTGKVDPAAAGATAETPGGYALHAYEEFSRAIDLDSAFYDSLGDRVPAGEVTGRQPRLAIAYLDRASLGRQLGLDPGVVASDFEAAEILSPGIDTTTPDVDDRELQAWMPMLDLVSWRDPVMGRRLRRDDVRLVQLPLATDLASTANIALLAELRGLVDRVGNYAAEYGETNPPEILVTGSAAIGGDTLTASRDAIAMTEWFTVALVLLILAIVYRSPLLVAVPLVSIALAVMVATGLVALLASASAAGWTGPVQLRIYTTSRVFVFVILFGAGTDYCLFLIARLRERVQTQAWAAACRSSLLGVGGALIGSGLTTIFGLSMLGIADFGKFAHTGPTIAVCLAVALAVCLTLTPALLRVLGPRVFWPAKVVPAHDRGTTLALANVDRPAVAGGFWAAAGRWVTRWPITILLVGWGLLVVPAVWGVRAESNVSYNVAAQLDPAADSRRGYDAVAAAFGVGEINPVTILAVAAPSPTPLLTRASDLSAAIYEVPGVRSVRSISDPMGDFPPTREMSLLSRDAWRRRAMQNHRLTRLRYVSPLPLYADRLVRLDVTIDADPFTPRAADKLREIQTRIDRFTDQSGADWAGTEVLLTGTTPSIVDLRRVTISDTRRIKYGVIGAVFVVLLLLLRRVVWAAYLMATVLLSYYATLGLTAAFFAQIDRSLIGETVPLGLDWKLPLFLFVILVAIGQDYNVYLVTRILQEQGGKGSSVKGRWSGGGSTSPAAVRRAVARTGGIITACGVIMAATFLSMTAPAWWPSIAPHLGLPAGSGVTLRGLTQLGFALGLGVLIDTLYVRTVLVPSFIAWHR